MIYHSYTVLQTLFIKYYLRVRSHWASNFASASNSQMQTQSYSLNGISNPFYFNHKLSQKFSCKVNHDVSWSVWMDIMKWVWCPIEWGTLRLHLRITRRRKRRVARSVWTDTKWKRKLLHCQVNLTIFGWLFSIPYAKLNSVAIFYCTVNTA